MYTLSKQANKKIKNISNISMAIFQRNYKAIEKGSAL